MVTDDLNTEIGFNLPENITRDVNIRRLLCHVCQGGGTPSPYESNHNLVSLYPKSAKYWVVGDKSCCYKNVSALSILKQYILSIYIPST
jgi:hypothetical protein